MIIFTAHSTGVFILWAVVDEVFVKALAAEAVHGFGVGVSGHDLLAFYAEATLDCFVGCFW